MLNNKINLIVYDFDGVMTNNKVYIDGKSKYSFTDVAWNAKWIIENLNLKNQLVEVGSTDFIELKKLAEKIKSTSEFEGEIDNQVVINKLNENGNYFFYIQCGPEQNEISKNIIDKIKKKIVWI